MRKNRRGASIIEYAVLIVMFLAAILLMQKSIARTFFGRWKDAGDSFGSGEQYDPNLTKDCGRYVPYDPNVGWGSDVWYNAECYAVCRDNGGSGSTCASNCPCSF